CTIDHAKQLTVFHFGTGLICSRFATDTLAREARKHVERKTISIMKACELVGVSRRTIYNWLSSGKIEYVRTAGGSVRIFVDTLWRDPNNQDRAATSIWQPEGARNQAQDVACERRRGAPGEETHEREHRFASLSSPEQPARDHPRACRTPRSERAP